MKLIVRAVSLALILVLGMSTGSGQTEFVTILHVNDSHSNLATIGPRTADLEGALGGIARVATIVERERRHTKNLLFLHAGDMSIGDLFFNRYFAVPELTLLKRLGLDAMAVGNHEFDLTPVALEAALQNAFPHGGFPLLSANLNLDDPAVEGLKQYIGPYTIKKMGKLKVGIFGLTTPATNLLSQPSPAYVEETFIETAGLMVYLLKEQGCDLIICLSHLGVLYDQLVATYVPGIDVIVGGHDHFTYDQPVEVLNPDGDVTWIVQASSFYLNVGKMRLKIHKGDVRLMKYELIPVDSKVKENRFVAAAVAELIQGIEGLYGPLYSQQVGYVADYFAEVATDLFGAGNKDTPIGNLVTDAYRAMFGTDVAIQVGGSTAHPLYPGPIVAADLFRVSGYGFNTENGLGYRMATFKMPGYAIYGGLEFGVSGLEENFDEFLIQTSGMQYFYDPERPPFSRIVGILIDGVPLDPFAEYTVTANEFVPIFLDFLGISYSDLVIMDEYSPYGTLTEFETLFAYVTALGQPLVPLAEGRVVCVPGAPSAELADLTTEDLNGSTAIPESFALQQNYPNPFNPSTVIPYALAKDAYVSLKVYNVLGQEVTTLVASHQPAGRYQATWDARGLATGLYLVRIEAGDFVSTMKVQLVK